MTKGALPPLPKAGPHRVTIAIAAATSFGLGFVPLFSQPGYEAALGAGVVLPALAACGSAVELVDRRPLPFTGLGRGVWAGVVLAAVYLALNVLHGLRSGFCEPLPGLWLFVLGPGIGAMMGGAAGAVSAWIAERLFVTTPRRRRWGAAGVALLWPVAGIAVSVGRFYTSPMVFAYDPFFGFFSGPLYDTIIEPIPGLTTYRVGSALTLLALAVVAWHLTRDAQGRLRWRGLERPGITAWGALAALGSMAHAAYGAELGHWSTTASIERALGKRTSAGRCDVVYSRPIPEREALLVARECEGHLRQHEAYFATRHEGRVTVFLFANAAEKGRQMGAAHTYIAKPWRREVYVQAAPFPHPVLGHELAHVVTGNFGAGPLEVAGPFGGLLPDPGRIEGFAVAASPRPDDPLTLAEWARAMRDLGLLPPLDAVFRLSFLGQNSSTAYTVAGAFVTWLHERYGAAVLRRWYSGEELRELTSGKDLHDLEREWQEALNAVVVSPEAQSAAKTRFDRPAIFGRTCPHAVDRLYEEAVISLNFGDISGARERLHAVLELDPRHLGARLGLGRCALRRGELERARQLFAELARDPALTRVQRAEAAESAADVDVLRGDLDRAREQYGELMRVLIDEHQLRTLEVKRLIGDPPATAALQALLLGDPRLGSDFAEAAALLSAWSIAQPERGVASFLLGKNLYNAGRWSTAKDYLDVALARDLHSVRIEREALRVRLLVACAQKDSEALRAAFQRWRALPKLPASQLASMLNFMRRCDPSFR